MNKKIMIVLFLVLWVLGFAVFFSYAFQSIPNVGRGGITLKKPNAETLRLVQPLGQYPLSAADRVTLAKFYADFSAVVAADSREVLKTNLEFRNCNRASCSVFFQKTGIGQRYSGIESAVDDVLAAAIGGERDAGGEWASVEIDAATRTRLADTLDGVAWAFYYGGNG